MMLARNVWFLRRRMLGSQLVMAGHRIGFTQPDVIFHAKFTSQE